MSLLGSPGMPVGFLQHFSIYIVEIPKDQLSTVVLVEGCNLLPALRSIGQKLLYHQDQGINLVVGFALSLGHLQQGRGWLLSYLAGQKVVSYPDGQTPLYMHLCSA